MPIPRHRKQINQLYEEWKANDYPINRKIVEFKDYDQAKKILRMHKVIKIYTKIYFIDRLFIILYIK